MKNGIRFAKMALMVAAGGFFYIGLSGFAQEAKSPSEIVAGRVHGEWTKVASMPAAKRMGLETYSMTLPMPVGNYDVTMEFGDEEKPTVSWVKFEGRRVALERVETNAGEKKRVTFTARVKGPIAKGDGPSGEAPFPYELNLTLITNQERIDSPVIVPNEEARVIYLCGDSTVTDQQKEPWGSWGQCLPVFFREGTAVANFARNGLTTKTFLDQLRLERILAHIKARDIVLIQFGHNDQKREDLKAQAGYKDKLNYYIDKITAKGARAVIISPMERLRFNEATAQQEPKTLEDYALAAREVAESRRVAFIDLNSASYKIYGVMGAKDSPRLFCTYTISRQLQDFYPEGSSIGKVKGLRELNDKTHHSIYGAYMLAHYIADRLVELMPELAPARREGYERLDLEALEKDPCIPPSGVIDTTRPQGDTGNKE